MKRFFFIALIVVLEIPGFAQSLSQKDLNEHVRGILFYGNSSFLVTAGGFLQLPDQEINDEYRDYYRKVYGDSTIVNPNTVLANNDSEVLEYIVPFINVSDFGKNFINLPDDYQLNDFLATDSSGRVEFRQGLYSIIGEIMKEQKENK